MPQFDTSLWQLTLARKKQEKEAKREAKLQQVLEIVAAYFSGRDVSSVYLCGSLLRPDAFDDRSDIDVAVSGLSEEGRRVAAELEELIGREVDLIELENCRFRAQIEREGRRVL